MASTQTPGLFSPITQSNIQDPSLSALNNELQRICNAIQDLQAASSGTSSSSSSSSSSWSSYSPLPTITGSGLTLSSFANEVAQMLNTGDQLFVNLDISFTLAGTGSNLMISLPSAAPAQNQFGNVMSCVIYNSPTPIAGIARLTTVGSTAGIYVYRADGANFTTGATEIVVSGWYQL